MTTLNPYDVTVGTIRTTLLLTDADARARGLEPRANKVRPTVQAKAAPAEEPPAKRWKKTAAKA